MSFEFGCLALAALVIVVFGCAINQDSQKWDVFAAQHHCVQTGANKLSTIFIPRADGNNDVMFSREYEWRCDGNKIVWR